MLEQLMARAVEVNISAFFSSLYLGSEFISCNVCSPPSPPGEAKDYMQTHQKCSPAFCELSAGGSAELWNHEAG